MEASREHLLQKWIRLDEKEKKCKKRKAELRELLLEIAEESGEEQGAKKTVKTKSGDIVKQITTKVTISTIRAKKLAKSLNINLEDMGVLTFKPDDDKIAQLIGQGVLTTSLVAGICDFKETVRLVIKKPKKVE